MTNHGRDQADWNQSKRRQQGLPGHEAPALLARWKNQVTSPRVVFPVHPRDCHEVRKLPKEQMVYSIQAFAFTTEPDAAAQPISGGMAPGTAPTNVQSGVFRFRGV